MAKLRELKCPKCKTMRYTTSTEIQWRCMACGEQLADKSPDSSSQEETRVGKLTGRETDVLNVIKDHYKKHGQAPRPIDVANSLGFEKVTGVSKYITALESYGFVKRTGPLKERRVELTGSGAVPKRINAKAKPLKPIPRREMQERIRWALGFYDQLGG